MNRRLSLLVSLRRHGNTRRRVLRSCCTVFVFMALWLLQDNITQSSVVTTEEYKIKGAFLFNFLKYVTWPENSSPTGNTEWVLGVLGDDPFGPSFDDKLKGRLVHGRPVTILRFTHPDSVGFCHILFFDMHMSEDAESILASLDSLPVLTVGETNNFLHDGGVIRFLLKDNKVRFEVNRDSSERAGLRISSKLLRLAVTIRDWKPEWSH